MHGSRNRTLSGLRSDWCATQPARSASHAATNRWVSPAIREDAPVADEVTCRRLGNVLVNGAWGAAVFAGRPSGRRPLIPNHATTVATAAPANSTIGNDTTLSRLPPMRSLGSCLLQSRDGSPA